jgi:hypothetical protein
MLISAVGALSTAIGVLWGQNVKLRRQLDHLHADHLDDIKTLTHEQIALAKTLMYAPPLQPSAPPARALPHSGDSSDS